MGDIVASTALVFLHLSDIHFRGGRTNDVHDEDRELRNELLRDLRRLRTSLPKVDGLFVSGDIAFAGKADEYETATNWIESVREAVGCPTEGVMVTPGNHDVDRDLIPDGGEIAALQERIRRAPTMPDRNAELARVLRHPQDGQRLLEPLRAYNQFAARYGCAISPSLPFWERSFTFADGSLLRFRGVTTTMLSSKHDDDQTHKMLYGGAQCTILQENGVRHVVIGHHPPSWCFETDHADHVWSTRTVLQAFGHKHDQWITSIGNSVRVIAGAFHPDRLETQWLPRYSAIAFIALPNNQVTLRIYPRRWSFEELTFIPDFNSQGMDYREFIVTVE